MWTRDQTAAETTLEIPYLSRFRVRNSAYIKRCAILIGLAVRGASKADVKQVKNKDKHAVFDGVRSNDVTTCQIP